VIYWPFTSTTQDLEMLQKEGCEFFGNSGKRTLFIINPATARNVQGYSAYKKERERMLLPGTPLRVMAIKPEGDLTKVYLEEDTKAPMDLIATGDDTYAMVEPDGFYDLLGDTSEIYAKVFEDDGLYAMLEGDDDLYGTGGEGGGAAAPASSSAAQCTRPHPNGGFCKNKQVIFSDGKSKFCKGHSCPSPGCTESKSSSAAKCAKHLSGKAGAIQSTSPTPKGSLAKTVASGKASASPAPKAPIKGNTLKKTQTSGNASIIRGTNQKCEALFDFDGASAKVRLLRMSSVPHVSPLFAVLFG
jgi:hypothetical protein